MSTFGKPRTGLDETLRPALMGVVLNLLRTSALGRKVPIDQVVQFVGNQWKQMYAAGTFDLTPLFKMLMAQPGVAQDDVAEIFLLLKERETRLGVTIKLPPAVEALPPTERERLLTHVQRVGVQSGVTLSNLPRVTATRPDEPKAPEHPAEGLVDRVRAILNPPKKP
ncbi:MAG: hypothetical protein AB2A00_01770 [Myxococcota bacterium]